jgi:ribose 5-phosphate isomerase A
MSNDAIEASKKLAAYTAVDKHVLAHHKIIGIGSGSTVPYVVDRIKQQGEEVNKDRVFIPTSFQSQHLIVDGGLRLGSIDQYPSIDVTIDGADEVDPNLHCIKGGGACQLREKVLAEAAETFVVVADFRKNSNLLGKNYPAGVPIEVTPFAYAPLLRQLQKLAPNAKLRMAQKKAGPVVTDNGNFVIDAPFGPDLMSDPAALLSKLKQYTGIVEVGLFCNMAKFAYFGNEDGSVTLKTADGKTESITA